MGWTHASHKFIAPIIGGDPNFTEWDFGNRESKLSESDKAFLQDENLPFLWANKDLSCRSVPNLPDHNFKLQRDHAMQVFFGRIHAADEALAFPCASAELQPVRVSYSVDERGNLATRGDPRKGTGDGRKAEDHGILLGDIGHNIIALGLRVRPRPDDLPQRCITPCVSPEEWCSCTKSCGTEDACKECENDPPCTREKPWCDCSASCAAERACCRCRNEFWCDHNNTCMLDRAACDEIDR